MSSKNNIILNELIAEKVEVRSRLVDFCIDIFPQITTKNSVKKALKRKELLLNGSIGYSGDWVNEGDLIQLIDSQKSIPKQYLMDIEIVYEDDYLVIVNKPAGLVVNGNRFKTLENCLINVVQPSTQMDALKWAKPLHRLDGSTSGLVIFSKTFQAHARLSEMFKNREIKKEYQAIIQGKIAHDQTIESPIAGKDSKSLVHPIKCIPSLKNEFLTSVKLSPITGRTHQLRIHCKEIGHPIVGDSIYGYSGNTLQHKGLFLCAYRLQFSHPITNKKLVAEIKTPSKFENFLLKEECRWKKYHE